MSSATSAPSRSLIKAALIDLNGTLHIGDQAIPNSIAALKRLRDAGILVRDSFAMGTIHIVISPALRSGLSATPARTPLLH